MALVVEVVALVTERLVVMVVMVVQVLSLFDTYNQLPVTHPSSSMALVII
jgi:hypothetical protein